MVVSELMNSYPPEAPELKGHFPDLLLHAWAEVGFGFHAGGGSHFALPLRWLFFENRFVAVAFLEFEELFADIVNKLFFLGVTIKVFELIRVGFEVVEFPLSKFVKVDEFVAFGADAVVAGDLMVGRILVVVVVDGFTPVVGLVAFEQWDEGSALHVAGCFCPGHLEKGLCVVEVLNEIGIA